MSVALFLAFFFFTFAVFGLHLFSDGYFNRCRLTEKPINATFWPKSPGNDWCDPQDFDSCPKDQFCGSPDSFGMSLEADGMNADVSVNYRFATFENLFLGIFTVFQVVTLDGWTTHMYSLMDSSSSIVSAIFFIVVVVFGNFVLLDLVLAVIIESFTKYTSEDELTVEQLMALIKMVIAKKFNQKQFMVEEQYQEQKSGSSWYEESSLTSQQDDEEEEQIPQIKPVGSYALGEEKISDKSDLQFDHLKPANKKSDEEFVRKRSKSDLGSAINNIRKKSSKAVRSILKKNTLKEPSVASQRKSVMIEEHKNDIDLVDQMLLELDQESKKKKSQIKRVESEVESDFQQEDSLDHSLIGKSFQKPILQKSLIEQEQEALEESTRALIANAKTSDKPVKYKDQLAPQKKQINHRQRRQSTVKIKPSEIQNALVSGNLNPQQLLGQQTLEKQEENQGLEVGKRSSAGKSNFQKMKRSATKSKRALDNHLKRGSILNNFERQPSSIKEVKVQKKMTTFQPQEEKQDLNRIMRKLTRPQKQVTHAFEPDDIQALRRSQRRADDNAFYNFFFKLVMSMAFNQFIQVCIIANTVVLSLDRYPIEVEEQVIHEILNQVFAGIFFLELILKLLGLGVKTYWSDVFNKFDCIIVLLSLIELSLQYGIQIQTSEALIAVRAFRLLRIFKLARAWKELNKMITTISRVLKDMNAFGFFFLIFFYIFTLIGMELFAYQVRIDKEGVPNQKEGQYANSNFNMIFEAIYSVFIVLVNDGWSTVFFQHARAVDHSYKTYIYFIVLLLLGQYLIFNLFVAILLTKFEEDSINNQKDEEEELAEVRRKKDEQEKKKMTKAEKEKLILDKVMKQMRRNGQLKSYKTIKADQRLLTGKSLFIFSADWAIRRKCDKIVTNQKFELFIMTLIFLSTITLSIENPLYDPDSQIVTVLFYFDIFFSIAFTLESLSKIIAWGFVFNGSESYLRDTWNIMDFFIVMVSNIDFFIGNDLQVFKIFRVIRTLRPLRVITTNEGFKIVLQSLVLSFKDILNGVLISFLFYFIFSIMFVNMFKGKLHLCSIQEPIEPLDYYSSEQQCLNFGGSWIRMNYTYDNVALSMMTLFTKSITVGWADQMYYGVRTRNQGYTINQGEKESPELGMLSVVFMFVCSHFILNIFIGIVISSFNRGKEQVTNVQLIGNFQKLYISYQEIILQTKPLSYIIIKSRWRAFLQKIVDHKYFDAFIFICLILNSFVLACKWYDMDKSLESTIEQINLVFLCIFIIEVLSKIAAYKQTYFQSNWNRLDMTTVSLSTLALFFELALLDSNSIILKVLKALRIVRLIRLIRRVHTLRVILYAILNSASKLFNVAGLMILFLYIFSILGVNLFSTTKITEPLDEGRMNFQSFWSSFLLLFRACTGENWHLLLAGLSKGNQILYQCESTFSYETYIENGRKPQTCGSSMIASTYFVLFIMIVNLMFLNLFIAVILEGFYNSSQNENSDFNLSIANQFAQAWKKFDPKGSGFIKRVDMESFLKELGTPLAWNEEQAGYSRDYKENFVMNLELSLYNDFLDYQFYDVLEALTKKLMIDSEVQHEVSKNDMTSEDINKLIAKRRLQIDEVEKNLLNIDAVTKINKIKNKSKKDQMFNVISHKEHLKLIKFVYDCKKQVKILKKKKLEEERQRIQIQQEELQSPGIQVIPEEEEERKSSEESAPRQQRETIEEYSQNSTIVNFQNEDEEEKAQHQKMMRGPEPEPEVLKKTSSITTIHRQQMESPSFQHIDLQDQNQQSLLIVHRQDESASEAEELLSEESKSSKTNSEVGRQADEEKKAKKSSTFQSLKMGLKEQSNFQDIDERIEEIKREKKAQDEEKKSKQSSGDEYFPSQSQELARNQDVISQTSNRKISDSSTKPRKLLNKHITDETNLNNSSVQSPYKSGLSRKLSQEMQEQKPQLVSPEKMVSELGNAKLEEQTANPFIINPMMRDRSSSQSQMFSGKFGVPSSMLSSNGAPLPSENQFDEQSLHALSPSQLKVGKRRTSLSKRQSATSLIPLKKESKPLQLNLLKVHNSPERVVSFQQENLPDGQGFLQVTINDVDLASDLQILDVTKKNSARIHRMTKTQAAESKAIAKQELTEFKQKIQEQKQAIEEQTFKINPQECKNGEKGDQKADEIKIRYLPRLGLLEQVTMKRKQSNQEQEENKQQKEESKKEEEKKEEVKKKPQIKEEHKEEAKEKVPHLQRKFSFNIDELEALQKKEKRSEAKEEEEPKEVKKNQKYEIAQLPREERKKKQITSKKSQPPQNLIKDFKKSPQKHFSNKQPIKRKRQLQNSNQKLSTKSLADQLKDQEVKLSQLEDQINEVLNSESEQSRDQ